MANTSAMPSTLQPESGLVIVLPGGPVRDPAGQRTNRFRFEPGQSLRGVNLRGVNLANVNLAGANLTQ